MAENCREFINNTDDDRPFFLYFATSDPHRGGGKDQTSKLDLKADLFGNKPNRKSWEGVDEVFYDPAELPIPHFLSDTPETREELAQYYQSVSRIDQGVARLVSILKDAGLYDKTMIVFTSDHGMAFAGGKTTTYEGGLNVPFVVRNPYNKQRGVRSSAMISHIDITPTMLDFAGGLDHNTNGPKQLLNYKKYWADKGRNGQSDGGHKWNAYHGKVGFTHSMNKMYTLGNNFCFPYISRNSDVLSNASREGFKLQTHLEYRTPTPLSICFRSLAASAGKLNSRREKRLCMDKRRSINTSSEIDLNSLILRTIPMNHVTSPMIQNLQSNSKSTRLCSSNTRN